MEGIAVRPEPGAAIPAKKDPQRRLGCLTKLGVKKRQPRNEVIGGPGPFYHIGASLTMNGQFLKTTQP